MSELAAETGVRLDQRARAAARLDFAQIVRDNQAMVYSIAYHSVGDRSLAEELAQDVFLQLHKNLSRIASADHARHWLRKVTCHRVIDRSRRLSERLEVDFDQAPEPSASAEPGDPLLRDWLRKLVASLPEKRRSILILRYQEEMELDEIAESLNMPVRTVRTQLFRTLALLREKASRVLGEVAL